MIKTTVTLQEVIDLFNEAIKADPEAMYRLLDLQVPCNNDLAKHPTIQVTQRHRLGVLGLMNGIFGADDEGWGTFAASYEVVCPQCGKSAAVDIEEGNYKVEDECPICHSILEEGPLVEIIDLNRR